MTTRERCESAIRYRKNGANCAQSLLAAFADVMGITEAQAMAMGAGLGGGVRSGNICGAVNAPVMILGCACPEMAGSKAKAAEITKGVPAAVYGAIPASQLPGAAGGEGAAAHRYGAGAGGGGSLRAADRQRGGDPVRDDRGEVSGTAGMACPVGGISHKTVGREPCVPPPPSVIPSQCTPRSKCPWGTLAWESVLPKEKRIAASLRSSQ